MEVVFRGAPVLWLTVVAVFKLESVDCMFDIQMVCMVWYVVCMRDDMK